MGISRTRFGSTLRKGFTVALSFVLVFSLGLPVAGLEAFADELQGSLAPRVDVPSTTGSIATGSSPALQKREALTISFDANMPPDELGDDFAPMASLVLEPDGQRVLPKESYARGGYEFAGWSTAPDSTAADAAAMPLADCQQLSNQQYEIEVVDLSDEDGLVVRTVPAEVADRYLTADDSLTASLAYTASYDLQAASSESGAVTLYAQWVSKDAPDGIAARRSEALGGLMPMAVGDAPVTADGTTIESMSARWISVDTDTEDPGPFDLYLAPATDAEQTMRFQLDYALSGEHPYPAGAVRLYVPRQVWTDRDGKLTGTMTLSVPEADEPRADFNYTIQVVDGKEYYVIANTAEMTAASKYMFQFTIRGITPHTIVDKQMSDDIVAYIEVDTTPDDTHNTSTTLTMKADTLRARINTHEEVTAARKQEGTVYINSAQARAAGLSGSWLPDAANPDDYIYVRWYTYGTVNGNKYFNFYLNDRAEDNYEAIMLGATWNNGRDSARSTDGKNLVAHVYDGYEPTGTSNYAYVWTAYPKAQFDEYDTTYTLRNSATWRLIEYDENNDRQITERQGSASVVYRTPRLYEAEKVWDHEDGYGNKAPQDVIDRYAQQVTVSIYRRPAGSSSSWSLYRTVTMDDSTDWKYDWVDDSQTNYVYRIVENVPPWYRASYQTLENGHKFVVTNKYHVPGYIPWDNLGISKYTNTYTDSNKNSTGDKALNILRDDTGNVVVGYTVSATSRMITLTYKNVDGDHGTGDPRFNPNNYGQLKPTLEVIDGRVAFEGVGELYKAEYDIESVVLSDPTVYNFAQPAGQPWVDWGYIQDTSGAKPPVELWGQRKDDDEWVLLATMSYGEDGTGAREVTPAAGSGASLDASDSRRVVLPEGIYNVKTRSSWNSHALGQSYRVNVRVYPSERVKAALTALFATDDFPMRRLDNTVTANVYRAADDETNPGQLAYTNSATSYAWLHGRDVKVAVTSAKSIWMDPYKNDTVMRRSLIHNSATVVEQSNMRTAQEYAEAKEAGLIPIDAGQSGEAESTWYDLLPKGMEPVTESVKLADGDRLTFVDTVPNYKGSGRTLLIVKGVLARHESGSTIDYTSGFRGYRNTNTISFDAWYSWDALLDHGPRLENHIAFQTGDTWIGNAIGYSGEADNPSTITGQNNNRQTANAVSGSGGYLVNLDTAPEAAGHTDDPRFVYARGVTTISPDIRALTGLQKRVTVDGTGEWAQGLKEVVEVGAGQRYTYMLRVMSDSNTRTKEIVVLDALDRYNPTSDKGADHNAPSWRGKFQSLDLTTLESAGIRAVPYYATADSIAAAGVTDDADTVADRQSAAEKFIADGLYVKDEYTQNGVYIDASGVKEGEEGFAGYQLRQGWSPTPPADPTQVVAVAIDCMKKTNGEDFILEPDESIVGYVHMIAPTPEEAEEAYKTDAHAFNNVYLHSVHSTGGDFVPDIIHDDYTKVGIRPYTVEVIKVWDDQDDNDGKRPDAIKVYLLANGERVKKSDGTDRYIVLDGQASQVVSGTDGEFHAWIGEFTNLAYAGADGNRIAYSFEEEALTGDWAGQAVPIGGPMPDGYLPRLQIVPAVQPGTDEIVDPDDPYFPKGKYGRIDAAYRLTNYKPPEKMKVSGTKTWANDDLEGDNARPDYITVTLQKRTGTDPETWEDVPNQQKNVYPADDGTWTYEFTNLDRYVNKQQVVYRVVETPVYKYIASGTDRGLVEKDAAAGRDQAVQTYDLANTYHPFGDLSVSKTVHDGTNVSNDEEFTFHLSLTSPATETQGEQALADTFEYELTDAEGTVLGKTGDPMVGWPDRIGNGDFKLKHGWTLTVKEVPSETRYSVTEDGQAGFSAASEIVAGTITANSANRASFDNYYSATGNAYLGVQKRMNGRTVDMNRAQFQFQMKDVTPGSRTEGQVLRTASNTLAGSDGTAFGAAMFGAVTYTQADHGKTFYYEITEIDRGRRGYVYDPRVITAVVKPVDKGDGTMDTSDVKYYWSTTGTYDDATGTWTTHALGESDWVPLNGEADRVFDNEYRASGQQQLKAWKVLNGRALGDGEFMFKLVDGGVVDTKGTADESDDVVVSDATGASVFTEGEGASAADKVFRNAADGTVTFDAISYTQADIGKKFTYVAREVKPSEVGGSDDATVKYSAQTFTYTVTVQDNGDGTLSFEQEVVNGEGAAAVPVFQNELEKGKLAVSKLPSGDISAADPNQTFRFRIELEGEDLEDREFNYDLHRLNSNGVVVQGASESGVPATRSAPAATQPREEAIEDNPNPLAPAAGATVRYSGTSGTCTWEIYTDGTMVFRPVNGVSGTMDEWPETATGLAGASGIGASRLPWYSYRSSVTRVEVQGHVKLKTMYAMFAYFDNLRSVDLTGLDTSDVKNMDSAFWDCSKLTAIDLTMLDTRNVTNMNYLFGNSRSLEYVDVSTLDMGNVTMFDYFFNGNPSLKTVNLGPQVKLQSNSKTYLPDGTWIWEPDPSVTRSSYALMNGYVGATMSGIWYRGSMADISRTIHYNPNSSEATGNMASQVVGMSLGKASAVVQANAFEIDRQFIGWNTAADGSGISYQPGETITLTANSPLTTTLYAQWAPEDYFKLDFDANGGAGSMPTLWPSSANGLDRLPDADFYQFGKRVKEWNTKPDGSGTTFALNGAIPGYDGSATPPVGFAEQQEATLYAIWEDDPRSAEMKDGTIELHLHANEQAVIPDLPAGTTYRVYEETPTGWVLVQQSGTAGDIEPLQTADARFWNAYQPGAVSVALHAVKNLDGSPVDAGTGASFTFSLYENGRLVQDGVHAGAGGLVAFDPITYTRAGVHTYQIREAAGADRTIDYDTRARTVTVNVADDGKGNLTPVVEYGDGGAAVFENAHKSGSLRIVKNVQGATDLARGDAFTVKVDLANPNVSGYPRTETLTVTADEPAVIDNLPVGTTFTVTETDLPPGWNLVSESGTSGTIAAGAESTATITNAYQEAQATAVIRAAKQVDGRPWKAGEEFTFTLSRTRDDVPMPTEGFDSATGTAKATATEALPTAAFGAITFTQDMLRDSDGTYEDHRDFYYTIDEDLPTDDGGNLITRNDDGTAAAIEPADWASGSHITSYRLNGTSYDRGRHGITVRLSMDDGGNLATTVIHDDVAEGEGSSAIPVFRNVYAPEPVTGFRLDAYKLLNGSLLARNQYTVEVYDNNGDIAGDGTTAGIVDANPRNGGDPYRNGDYMGEFSIAAGGHGTMSVTDVTFTRVGTYYYQLREQIPNGARSTSDGLVYDSETTSLTQRDSHTWYLNGRTYDSTVVDVVVRVTDDGNGHLQASPSYSPSYDEGDAESGGVVSNTYVIEPATATISANKLLTGDNRQWMETDFFIFELTPVDGAPLHVWEDGAIVDKDVLTDIARSNHRTVEFDDLVYTLSDLGTDRSRTFTYRVHEAVYDDETFDDEGNLVDLNAAGDGTLVYRGFTYAPDRLVTVNVTDNGNGTMGITYGDDRVTAIAAPDFTNTYKITSPVTKEFKASKRMLDRYGDDISSTWVGVDANANFANSTFTFELKSSTDSAPMPEGAVPRGDGQEGRVVRQDVTQANPVAAFGTATFTQAGEWDYAIDEVLPSGVTDAHPVGTGEFERLSFDTSTHSIHVVVRDNGDGTLAEPEVTYRGGSLSGGAGPVVTNHEAGDADIVLQARKSMSGANLRSAEFSFTLYETGSDFDVNGAGARELEDTANTRMSSSLGAIEFEALEYTHKDIDHTQGVGPHETTHYYVAQEVGSGARGVTYSTGQALYAVTLSEASTSFNPSNPALNTVRIKEVKVGWRASADDTAELRTVYTFSEGDLADSANWEAAYAAIDWPTFTNEYEATGTAQLFAVKHVENRSWTDEDRFDFEVKPVGGAPMHVDGRDVDSLEGSAVSGSRTVAFERLQFTQEDLRNGDGTYDAARSFYYIVHERDMSGADDLNDGSGTHTRNGITYAANQTVRVNIRDDREGDIVVTYGGEDVQDEGGSSALAGDTTDQPRPQFNNFYSLNDSKTAQVQAAKMLVGRDWQPGDEFTFVLAAGSNDAAGDIDTPMPAEVDEDGNARVTVTYSSDDLDGTAGSKVAAFGEITFTEPGEYNYRITELVPDDSEKIPGVTYSEGTEHDVVVRVTDAGDGTLSVPEVIYGNAATPVPFENSYHPEPVSVRLQGQKTMVGRDLREGHYTFRVYEAELDSATGRVVVSGTQPAGWPHEAGVRVEAPGDSVGELEAPGRQFAQEGTYYFIVRETVPSAAVNSDGVRYGAATEDQRLAGGFTLDGVIYDSHDSVITVVVTDGVGGVKSGKLQAQVTYLNQGAPSESDAQVSQKAAFTNYYRASGSCVLSATKVIHNREWSPDDEFEFQLYPLTPHAPMPASGSSTAKATFGERTASFDQIDFDETHAGQSFDYIIREKSPTFTGRKSGMTYDETDHYAHVSVSDSSTGHLTVTVTYDGTSTESGWVDVQPGLQVVNEYAPLPATVSVPVSKKLTGRAWVNNEEWDDTYSFTLAAGANTAGEGIETPLPDGTSGETASATLSSASSFLNGDSQCRTTSFDEISFAHAGTYYYTLTEDKHVNEHGEVVNPYRGTTYDDDAWFVIVDVVDDGSGQLQAQVTYEEDDVVQPQDPGPVFENTYAASSVDLSLRALKTLDGSAPAALLPDNDFSFDLYRVSMGEDGRETGRELVQTATPSDDGTVAFEPYTVEQRDLDTVDPIDGHQSKVVWLVIKEHVPEDAADLHGDGAPVYDGVKYDAHEVWVRAVVEDPVDGLTELFVTDLRYGTWQEDGFKESDTVLIDDPAGANDAADPDGGNAAGDAAVGKVEVLADTHIANELAPQGALEVSVTKTLEGRPWFDKDAFSFELTAVGDDAAAAPLPDRSAAKAAGRDWNDGVMVDQTARTATVAATEDAPTASFGVIVFDASQAGRTFTYEVREIAPEGAERADDGGHVWQGVRYDSAVHQVQVKVGGPIPDEPNHLAIQVMVDGEPVGSGEAEAFANAEIAVTNPWSAAAVEVPVAARKELQGTGAPALEAGQFAFVLMSASGERQVVQEARNAADGTVAFDPIQVVADDMVQDGAPVASKTFSYVIREVVPDDAVNPEGVAYADASEEQRADGGFAKDGIVYAADAPVQVTAWISEDTGELKASVSYGADGATMASIVNRYDPERPQSGLREPWVRYGSLVRAGDPLAIAVIVLSGLAAAAALFMVARALRRRRG